MARSPLRIALVVATAVAVSWAVATGANAQDDNSVFGEQTGLLPAFPFRDCASKVGLYRLAPEARSLGGGKYCFTINVQTENCTGACCAADLTKIEFNVSSSCLVSPAAVVPATINGVPTRVGASFDRAVNGRPGAAILRLTQLALNTATARDAEICITLLPNRAGQGCTTLEQLCATQPGAPAGTCSAAMYDTPCRCCPVSRASVPMPTPSPSPSFPPANRRCEVCIISQLYPPAIDPRPYRYDIASCLSIQQQISSSMNSLLVQNNVTTLSYFSPNASFCSSTVVGTCGVLNATSEELQRLNAAAQGQVAQWVEISAGGDICRPELEGYQVQVTTGLDTCVNVSSSASCSLPPTPPFPNCTCNTTQGILPFTVSPRYFSMPSSNKASTTEYCFPISAIPQGDVVNSACATGNDVLAKISWYADQSMSPMVRGFVLYPATGNITRLSSSWGASGTNTLKATGINWTASQANGALICVELKKPASMADVCIGATTHQQCYLSVFNSNYKCCPTYRSGLLPLRV